MKRFLILVIEGMTPGGLFGFFISFLTKEVLWSILIGMIVGAVLRILIDFSWKKYNEVTGKA